MGASSFTSNPLLVKDSVGKTRPTVFDLPGDDHIYGKKVERNPEECAAQVLQHWNVKATSKHAVPALDYITMNRNTAKQGILSPRAIRDYRKEHPVRMKIGDHNLFGSDGIGAAGPNGEALTSAEARKLKLLGTLPHDNDSNFVYGMPTRPSTPVAYLMTDKYQREWINAEAKRNAAQAAQEKERLKKKTLATPQQRKTDIMESKPKKVLLVDKDPKTLFKMSKFLKQGPKISSWRDDKHNSGSQSSERPKTSSTAEKDLEQAIKGVGELKVKDKAANVTNATNAPPPREEVKPKVTFASTPSTQSQEWKQKNGASTLEPSPANKKLIAAPGAAPDGWSPN
ncbi:hypothetical protein BCR33DRAFT_713874 [Rhizoclosmatium globosum]|uniref:Uncharacterized protein n=1 Tax=Rhizoclosmatium globosum TaxID=329046 RepID=A0A1Y2CRF3_9FUNG|nr:hypothetical protein HDU99_000012 [Rhizoclosmatium hyalinum]ORY49563.1 hypothetical protein BCR33DRAFT_713874 [Rhizoclosmatium globosum]|eukprot:ORY49563.1 hypothetical protein BCR33DRAFT_713874 [Rhizoclosmatium globosum]